MALKRIYHYPVTEEIKMPRGAKILKFGMRQGLPTLWALVDPNRELASHYFKIFPTGGEIDVGMDDDEDLKYQDTVFDNGLVWHIFRDWGRQIDTDC